ATVAERGAVQLVRPRLGREQDRREAPAVLGGGTRRQDFEFLDAFQAVREQRPTVVVLFVVEAIDEHVEVAPAAAGKRHVVGGSTVCRRPRDRNLASTGQQVHHGGERSVEHGQLLHFGLPDG